LIVEGMVSALIVGVMGCALVLLVVLVLLVHITFSFRLIVRVIGSVGVGTVFEVGSLHMSMTSVLVLLVVTR